MQKTTPIAELAQPVVFGHVALEAGAGQVVEQDVVRRVEQFAPACFQEEKQVGLVLAEFVEAAVERIFGGNRVVFAEQVGHSAGIEPVAVQPPFAAGVEQPVGGQRFENVEPAGSLAAVRQTGQNRFRSSWFHSSVASQHAPH